MTALAANRGDVGLDFGPTVRIGVVASDIIYRGALVSVNAAGFLKPAADAAGDIFVGVALEQADNSAGAAGDVDCLVGIGGGLITLAHTAGGQAQANIGDEVGTDDDQTVDAAAGLVNNIFCGRIIKVNSATSVVVALYPFSTQS